MSTGDERIRELEELASKQAAQIAEQAKRIAELLQEVAELKEKLGRNSKNSHRPPSSDPPGSPKGKRKPGKKRKRGGQKGHRGAHRQLLPVDQVDDVRNLYPPQCECCAAQLPEVPDAQATRHQQVELPPIKPHVTEWRRHEVQCPCCDHKTRAKCDSTIPSSPFGPRLMAVMAVLTGIYHLSRRRTVMLLADMLGVQLSLGALSAVEARVSDAIEPAVNEVWERVDGAPVKHTDGTSWLQAGKMMTLWTIATSAVTVFKILSNHTKQTLQPLYDGLTGILVSDRAKELNFWTMSRRQICWAHLLRKFVSFSERDGPAARLGAELLEYTSLVFDYWQSYKSGKLSRAQFAGWISPVRQQFEATLQRAVAADIAKVSGACKDILQHKEALWTFVDEDGVPPTNNHGEQELRGFVLWRKKSYGTQSERGNRFAERMMTVSHTARKQKRNVFEFFTACCEARANGGDAPSLFAGQSGRAASAAGR